MINGPENYISSSPAVPYGPLSLVEMGVNTPLLAIFGVFAQSNQSTPVSGENDRRQCKSIAPPLKSNRTKFLRKWLKYRRVTPIRVMQADLQALPAGAKNAGENMYS